jgi:hypothetical protein
MMSPQTGLPPCDTFLLLDLAQFLVFRSVPSPSAKGFPLSASFLYKGEIERSFSTTEGRTPRHADIVFRRRLPEKSQRECAVSCEIPIA